MKREVLVGLRSPDRIDDAVFFLQDIVAPEMKIVFLIPYPVERWSYLPKHCDEAEIGRAATLVNQKNINQSTWETQRNLAEARLSGARQALRNQNVEIEFGLYTGRLTWAIREYVAHSEFHWIVTPTGRSEWIGTAIRDAVARLWRLKANETRGLYTRRYYCGHNRTAGQ